MTTILNRKLALAAGLVCLAAPVLSSCGFDYATDRPNVIADGGYAMTGNGLRVLAARIVADASGHGVFVATIALNPTANAAVAAQKAPQLTGLTTGSGSTSQVTASSVSPIRVNETGSINLADPAVGGIPVTGDFDAGAMIPLTLSFSDGSKITVQTPVVTRCGPYASIAPQSGGAAGGEKANQASGQPSGKAAKHASAQPTGSASASATGSASPSTTGSASPSTTDSASASATDSASASATESASAQPSAAASAPYDCSFPSLPPIGE